MSNKAKEFIFTFLAGIIMGIANIIPGVSGGTIAVGLGIFDKLIESINHFLKEPKKYLPFLIPLFLGVGFGILAFSSVVSFGLENYSFITNMFFVGLVVGSIPLIYTSAKEKNFKNLYYIYTIIGFLIVFLFATLEKGGVTSSTDEVGYLKLFLSGAVASSAMVIPGISGSFMMILLGVYNGLLEALAMLKEWLLNMSDISILMESLRFIIPMGIGIVIGVVLISKIIEFLFERFYSQTYLLILGLIFGSIYTIFTSDSTYASGVNIYSYIIGFVLFVVGYVLSTLLSKKS